MLMQKNTASSLAPQPSQLGGLQPLLKNRSQKSVTIQPPQPVQEAPPPKESVISILPPIRSLPTAAEFTGVEKLQEVIFWPSLYFMHSVPVLICTQAIKKENQKAERLLKKLQFG